KEISPTEPNVLIELARCQDELSDWEEVRDTYALLQQILLDGYKQNDPTNTLRLAWINYKLGAFEKASTLCDQVHASESDRDEARARLIMAAIAYISGDCNMAERHIRHVSIKKML